MLTTSRMGRAFNVFEPYDMKMYDEETEPLRPRRPRGGARAGEML